MASNRRRIASVTTALGYLSYIIGFYWLRARASQDSDLLDVYSKVKAVGVVRKAKSQKRKPLDPETVRKLLRAEQSYHVIQRGPRRLPSEDYVFLITVF